MVGLPGYAALSSLPPSRERGGGAETKVIQLWKARGDSTVRKPLLGLDLVKRESGDDLISEAMQCNAVGSKV